MEKWDAMEPKTLGMWHGSGVLKETVSENLQATEQ